MTNVLNTKAGMIGAGVLVAAVALYFFGRQAKALVTDAVDSVDRVNEGTPYEGFGVLGTLGNITNRASGGVLEGIGSRIGGAIYDIFHPYERDPNQRKLSSSAPAVQAVDKPGSLRY